jgi:quercetin dioxygenase-like cupin family protein
MLARGEGDSMWSLGGLFTVKLDHAASQGQLAVLEAVVSRAAEPPLHIHHREDEAWYVLDGHINFHVAQQVIEAKTGSFVFAPMGIPHAFTVEAEPTRVLVFATPSGFEGFVRDLGVPADGEDEPPDLTVPGPEILGPVGDRYGIEVIGPPLRLGE